MFEEELQHLGAFLGGNSLDRVAMLRVEVEHFLAAVNAHRVLEPRLVVVGEILGGHLEIDEFGDLITIKSEPIRYLPQTVIMPPSLGSG